METPETKTSFQNEHMTVQVTRQPNCIVVFDITVTPEATKAGRLKALKNINKEVSIPGFRKGKAPDNVILQRYSHVINDEAKDVIGRTAFYEAVELAKIAPMRTDKRIEMQVDVLSENEGAKVKIEFEHAPQIPEIDLEGFTVTPVEPKPVTQEQLDDHLKSVRRRLAKMEEVTDRPAEAGDRVVFDVEVIANKESHHQNNEELELSGDDWAINSLIGMSIGETKEVAPPEATEGQIVKFTVKKISKPVLPEMDEDFFKQVGVKDVEELGQQARKVLEKAAQDEAKNAMVEQLQTQMLDKYPFEIPLTLLVEDFKDKEFVRTLTQEGLEQAKKITRQTLICRVISDRLKLQISQDELRQAYYQQAVMASMQGFSPENDQQAQALVDLAYRRLLAQKVFDFLLEKAKKA